MIIKVASVQQRSIVDEGVYQIIWALGCRSCFTIEHFLKIFLFTLDDGKRIVNHDNNIVFGGHLLAETIFEGQSWSVLMYKWSCCSVGCKNPILATCITK